MVSLKRARPKYEDKCLGSGMIKKLDEIDLLYMRAYAAKSVEGLRQYLSPACTDKLNRVVHCYADRNFADKRFRHTKWEIVNVCGNVITLKKDVTFEKVRINSVMSIYAASRYAEQWVISVKKGIIIIDISEWESVG